jgi:hypothetical protein
VPVVLVALPLASALDYLRAGFEQQMVPAESVQSPEFAGAE